MGTKTMDKALWVEMFEAIGLDHDTMNRWHAEFERRAPESHQSFLEWLNIGSDEIVSIREQSREAWSKL
jgi:hypothetical protein